MRKLFLLPLLFLLFLIGCGGDSSEEPNTPPAEEDVLVAPPQIDEAELMERAQQLTQAAKTGECESYVPLIISLSRLDPNELETIDPKECDFVKDFLTAVADNDFSEDSQTFGPAAITEGPSQSQDQGYKTAIGIWASDPVTGEPSLIAAIDADSQVDKDPTGETKAVENASAFTEAVKVQDCKALIDTLRTDSLLKAASDKETCAGFFEKSVFFGKSVRGTSATRIDDLGQTIDYGFVGVATEDVYYVIILATEAAPSGEEPDPEMKVLDASPVSEIDLSQIPEPKK